MFKNNFRKFDFRGFIDFILELVDRYGLGEIRFNPEHKENFSEVQLTHIAPGRSINNPNGFVWAWKKCQNSVRRVSFDLFSKSGERKIAMTIDLNNKFISLDKEEGISSIEVEDILKNNMEIDLEKNVNEKEPTPVAIKVQGKLKRSIIEDNTTIGMKLLEAEGVEDSFIRRNKSLPNNPGSTTKKWWERTWIQILFVLGALAGIISLYSLFK